LVVHPLLSLSYFHFITERMWSIFRWWSKMYHVCSVHSSFILSHKSCYTSLEINKLMLCNLRILKCYFPLCLLPTRFWNSDLCTKCIARESCLAFKCFT
jgi:hypothetical protein